MEAEVGVDDVLRCGGDERFHRCGDGGATGRVDARGRQGGGLALDADAEVDHVEDVVMCADGRCFHGERCRFGHREHERPTALEGFDESLGA